MINKLCIIALLCSLAVSCGNNPVSSEDGAKLNNLPILGNADAKVTLIQYGDYQCHFCGDFFRTVESQIRKVYISTGKVKMVWRDFAFLGQESFWAAEAARCANDQGNFWEYHDFLFRHQDVVNQGLFSKQNLKLVAEYLNEDGYHLLERKEFNYSLDSGKYSKAVKDDTDAALAAGVNGVPYFTINGEVVLGDQSFDVFKTVIDKYLSP